MSQITEKIYALVKDTVETQGVTLWDVAFVKEGASKYLRIFIDKPEGINIDDCTKVSHAIDPVIDEADPIKESYFLEVCSCGLERELSRNEHFAAMIGRKIRVKLFKALDGNKEIEGTLKDFDGSVYLETETTTLIIKKAEIAKAILMDF